MKCWMFRLLHPGGARQQRQIGPVVAHVGALLGLEAEDFRRVDLVDALELGADPDLRTVFPHLHSAIQGLHWCMREVRNLVFGDDFLRRGVDRGRVVGLLRHGLAGSLRARGGGDQQRHQRYGNVEVKYIGPDGVTVDVSETGWVGPSGFSV